MCKAIQDQRDETTLFLPQRKNLISQKRQLKYKIRKHVQVNKMRHSKWQSIFTSWTFAEFFKRTHMKTKAHAQFSLHSCFQATIEKSCPRVILKAMAEVHSTQRTWNRRKNTNWGALSNHKALQQIWNSCLFSATSGKYSKPVTKN